MKNFIFLLFSFLVAITSVTAQISCNNTASFTFTQNGATVVATNTTTSQFNITQWYTSDGGSGLNPASFQHVFTQNGAQYICLYIAFYDSLAGITCSDTFCQPVTVTGASSCNASFNYSPSSTNPLSINFTNTSTGAGVNYYWSFGDGGVINQSSPNHVYAAAGMYTVCLIALDTAGAVCDSTCMPIIVSSTSTGCNAAYTFTVNMNGVSFVNTSTGGSFCNWNFGDGNFFAGCNPPVHVYTAPGAYQVCLTIYDSTCQSTLCDTVIINGPPPCQASFTFTNQSNNFSFVNTSTGTFNCSWAFGDGSTSTVCNPNHTYTANGIYGVCLTISQPGTPCQSTVCDTVVVTNVGITNLHNLSTNFNIYPNPTEGNSNIVFNLSAVSHVALNVYDLLGNKLLVLAPIVLQSGSNTLPIQLNKVPKGLYIISLQVNENIGYQKIQIE
jgi:PKD repeat protein